MINSWIPMGPSAKTTMPKWNDRDRRFGRVRGLFQVDNREGAVSTSISPLDRLQIHDVAEFLPPSVHIEKMTIGARHFEPTALSNGFDDDDEDGGFGNDGFDDDDEFDDDEFDDDEFDDDEFDDDDFEDDDFDDDDYDDDDDDDDDLDFDDDEEY